MEIRVHDDGIGIEPEASERIFEPFYRTDRERPGFGLGLAIARHLANAERGTLTVDSEPGAGTTFVLRLPAT